MSTLQSVDVSIDGLQNGNAISAKDYFAAVKDYPPVVDHASVMRSNSGVGNSVSGVSSISRNITGSNVTSVDVMSVRGRMVTAEMRLDAHQAMQMDDLELKNILVAKLVRELMNGRYIEFTKQQDVTRMETIIRARIFVTPDDQVRVIRKANYV